MKLKTIISAVGAALLLAACHTPKVYYAPAKITHRNGRILIQPLDKYRPMPDTVVIGYSIRKR